MDKLIKKWSFFFIEHRSLTIKDIILFFIKIQNNDRNNCCNKTNGGQENDRIEVILCKTRL
jgi:hypothetical protein